MKKLLVSRALPKSVMDALKTEFETTLRPTRDPMSSDEAISALQTYDAILPTLGDAFDHKAFDAVMKPRCRILANFGVGYNHIDVEAARNRGITVTNTPGAVTDATADIAMTLILMCARRAGEGERLVRSGKWTGWHPTQMLGMHVGGKTLGVVGMGRIGRAIARRAHFGFGMKVVFFNRSRIEDPGVPAQQLDRLSDLMSASDIVVLAVPGGAQTHHLIDEAALAAMPLHAILVNISRGDVIDEHALIKGLKKGRPAQAGLDVYAQEPHVPKALRDMENVALLPHLGTNAEEVRTDMGMMALQNLRAFFSGQQPPNRV